MWLKIMFRKTERALSPIQARYVRLLITGPSSLPANRKQLYMNSRFMVWKAKVMVTGPLGPVTDSHNRY